MQYSIDHGSISEALHVDSLIPEFEKKKASKDFESRLSNKRHLILIAKMDDEPIAYHIGYSLSDTEFYCWLAGVSPQYRDRGIANALRQKQEHWARNMDYKVLSVKSKNRFPAMLRSLIRCGYCISDYENSGDLLENKIHFSKQL